MRRLRQGRVSKVILRLGSTARTLAVWTNMMCSTLARLHHDKSHMEPTQVKECPCGSDL